MKKTYQLLLAGALLPFAFAPVSLPGFVIISLAWFFSILRQAKTKKQSFYHGFLYGTGLFGVGTSWIYISIHTYGQAEPWLAFILTVLFCLFMALYIAVFGLSYFILLKASSKLGLKFKSFRLFSNNSLWKEGLIFSALWVLFEYIRATLFTGFPWLLLGFSQMETPMKYLAPIFGVYGLSFLVAFSGCLLAMAIILLKQKNKKWIFPLCLMIILYLLPYAFKNITWVKINQEKIPVSIIQGNIDENEKWVPGAYRKHLEKYITLTKTIPENTKIIVWPEGALPIPYPQAQYFLEELPHLINHKQASIITGIPYESPNNENQYYNAIMATGNSTGYYWKHHLVPFGEYLPADIFRDIADSLGIPTYETARGAFKQPLLNIENIPTLPFICYEIAYADILLNALPGVQLLITISDDAWFGHSMARAQHVQMAQMRSLQSGRYQIVATNNGISGIINTKGKIIATVPSFETHVLNSYVKTAAGNTLWAEIGDNWILMTLGILLFACIIL